ncbi:MAG: carbon storage regulator [Colwellia sp.]|nr:carbon storage regulator [Colwellia sp.]
MFILNRSVRQTIVIGKDITVTVRAVSNGVVSLSIKAPRNAPVHREEIYVRTKEGETVPTCDSL